MTHYPDLSIIIPTYNRKHLLKEALLSLNNQRYNGKIEVIVVDDGSSDGTSELLSELKEKLMYSFFYYRTVKKGISHAKNVAIKKSKGGIIISTDDDCTFEKEWLNKLVNGFDSEKVGIVASSDRPYNYSTLFSKCTDYAFTCFIGSGGVHGRFLILRFGKFIPMGCNMAIKRTVIDEVGLFNETIAPGEETDLVHRIEKAGYEIKYIREAYVFHKVSDTFSHFIRKIFARGYARIEIIKLHGLSSGIIYIIPAIVVLLSILLTILSIFNKTALTAFLFLIFFYIILVFISGIEAWKLYRKIAVLFLVPFLIGVQHLMHGLGCLFGIFHWIKRFFKSYFTVNAKPKL